MLFPSDPIDGTHLQVDPLSRSAIFVVSVLLTTCVPWMIGSNNHGLLGNRMVSNLSRCNRSNDTYTYFFNTHILQTDTHYYHSSMTCSPPEMWISWVHFLTPSQLTSQQSEEDTSRKLNALYLWMCNGSCLGVGTSFSICMLAGFQLHFQDRVSQRAPNLCITSVLYHHHIIEKIGRHACNIQLHGLHFIGDGQSTSRSLA